MKIRKAIVAAATALTVASAGTVVANAQDDQNKELSSNLSSFFTNDDEKANGEDEDGETSSDGSSQKDGESDLANLSSNEDGEPDPDAIKSWIGVFTAVIGVLSAAFGFFATYF